MTAYKLHHTKFYTRHSENPMGHPHCYRCDEILANDNRVDLVLTKAGFRMAEYAEDYNGGQDDNGEYPNGPTTLVTMGSFCALKAIAGK